MLLDQGCTLQDGLWHFHIIEEHALWFLVPGDIKGKGSYVRPEKFQFLE